jgi:Tol biopolymer transport system component
VNTVVRSIRSLSASTSTLASAGLCALLLCTPGSAVAGEVWVAPRVSGGNCEAPVFGPDAASLAYTLNHHETRRIDTMLVDLAVGRPETVHVGADGPGAPAAFGSGAASVVHGITFAPATALTFRDQFVVSASDGSGQFEIYSSQSRTPLAAAPGHDGDAAWNPANEALLVWSSARSGEGDLYLLDFQAPDKPRRITSLEGSAEVDVSWSPDGQSIAYVAHSNAGDNVWVLDNLTGAAPRRLTATDATQVRPTWAPVGPPRIAFYQYARGKSDSLDRVDLMVATPQGGVRKLAEGVVADSNGPAWTPDGTAIIAVLDDSSRFDPVARIDAKSGTVAAIPTATVGNADVSVGYTRDGRVLLAVCAQGRTNDPQRDFRRAFVLEL